MILILPENNQLRRNRAEVGFRTDLDEVPTSISGGRGRITSQGTDVLDSWWNREGFSVRSLKEY